MKITIIAVGKMKRSALSNEINHYLKQLNISTTIIEINDEPNINGITKEGENIIKKIPENSYVISLVIEGKEFNSISFSKKIEQLVLFEKKNLTFIIGGSYGLSDEVVNVSNETLSFSKFTFPHNLMRVILIEQIYRAFKIIENHPYHK